MVINLQTYNEVLSITVPNLLKLFVISFIVFCIIPRYIFPQNHIKDNFDRFIYNIVYMVAAVLLIVPILVFLKIFSIIMLAVSFIVLKAFLIYIFEKKNYFKILRESYPPIFIKILNKLDAFYNFFAMGNIKEYKNLIALNKIPYQKIFFYVLLIGYLITLFLMLIL